MKRRLEMGRKLAVGGAVLVAAAATPYAFAGGGGPVPYPLLGWDGVTTTNGVARYVAIAGGSGRTSVAVIRVRDGRVLRYGVLPGQLGIPQVAWDGTSDGLSADGTTLVLASMPARTASAKTTFAVLSAKRLRLQRLIRLPGFWAFDAISPDGRTIYALQYENGEAPVKYTVRAVDTATGQVRPGAIVDKREAGEGMLGSPITRAWSSDRDWAFTLYAKPDGTAFVHALRTSRRTAVCLDLPWRAVGAELGRVRLGVSADGRTLMLHQPGLGQLASVDLGSLVVRSFRSPKA